MNVENGHAVVEAPSQVVASWVQNNYSAAFLRALGASDLEWVIAPPPAPPAKADRELRPPLFKRETASDERERLLAMYAVITGNVVRPEDRTAFKEVANCQTYQVMAGLYKAQFLVAGGKINSFSYVVKAVKEFELSREGPEVLEYWRQKLYGGPRQVELPGASGELFEGKFK